MKDYNNGYKNDNYITVQVRQQKRGVKILTGLAVSEDTGIVAGEGIVENVLAHGSKDCFLRGKRWTLT